MRALWCVVVVALCVAGCGDAELDAVGAYVGSSEQTTITNAGMRTTTQEEIISLTPTRDGGLWVALSDRCVVEATLDGDALKIAKQSCVFGGPTSEDTWYYQGQGSVADERLSLALSGTFKRTYKAGGAPLEGSYTSSFEGTRR